MAASDKRERVTLLPREQLRRWLDRLTEGADKHRLLRMTPMCSLRRPRCIHTGVDIGACTHAFTHSQIFLLSLLHPLLSEQTVLR